MARVTIEADVDFAEIEDISTDDLVRELADRGREVVLDALIMLKTGRIDDGIAALEREFFRATPMWRSAKPRICGRP